MRKFIAAVVSLPVLGAVYLTPLARRPAVLRTLAMLAVVSLLTVAAGSQFVPGTQGYRSTPADPVALARLATPVDTDVSVHQDLVIHFDQAMDTTSVAAALAIQPATPTRLGWSADDRTLTVTPLSAWQPDLIYTVTVGVAAHDQGGRALGEPLSSVFLTRGRPSVEIAATHLTQAGAALSSGLTLTFSQPVLPASVAEALTIGPSVAGVLDPGPSAAPATVYTWTPLSPLGAASDYLVTLGPGVSDTDGVAMGTPVAFDLSTAPRPQVVRARPASGSTGVARDQTISIRFSRAMDRASTQAAFAVSGLAAASAGTFGWLAGDTVMTWKPRKAYAAGARLTVTVAGTARDREGMTLGTSAASGAYRFNFTTQALARATAKATAKPTPRPPVRATTSAPYAAAEAYLLSLVNCTHTGGWVHSDGSCTGRGSNGLAPIRMSAGISNKVARPWAKYLADTRQLYHGCPACRFQAAGYTTNTWWGENLTQWTGNVYTGAIQALLFFQGERASNGGHWRNLMNARDVTAGIGIWQYGGRFVYTIDFYGLSVP